MSCCEGCAPVAWQRPKGSSTYCLHVVNAPLVSLLWHQFVPACDLLVCYVITCVNEFHLWLLWLWSGVVCSRMYGQPEWFGPSFDKLWFSSHIYWYVKMEIQWQQEQQLSAYIPKSVEHVVQKMGYLANTSEWLTSKSLVASFLAFQVLMSVSQKRAYLCKKLWIVLSSFLSQLLFSW